MVGALAWAACTVLRRVAEKGSDLYNVCVSTAGPLGFGRIPKEVASTKAVEYRIGSAAAQRELRGLADKRRLLYLVAKEVFSIRTHIFFMECVDAGGGRETMSGAEEGVDDEFGVMESPNGGSGV